MSGFDRDFSMSRTQKRVLVVGFVVWLAVGVLLFGGFLPGLKPTLATTDLVTIGGQPYHYELTSLHAPFFTNFTRPWNVTFYNVTFELWLTDWYSANGGVLHGIGTEPNGTSYPFVLGVLSPNGSRPTYYFSPDLAFGIGWLGGWVGGPFAHLYVRA